MLFHKLQVKEVRKETENCVSVALDVPETLADDFAFIPGQYLTFRTDIEGEEVRRSYSICAGPNDAELRVAIKLVPKGKFSTFANRELAAGDRLEVMPPMGRFLLETDKDNQHHYVAFAAGSGITPILSMLKAVLEEEPQSRFTLFYGNRTSESVIFRESIEALKNQYLGRLSLHHILSRELTDVPMFSGRIDAEKCAYFCDKLMEVDKVDQFLLCGPYAMIEQVRDTLTAKGVNPKNIHFELFTAPDAEQKKEVVETAEVEEVAATIQITLDGNSIQFPLGSRGETILDAALRKGADLPFACKGGVCSTCRAKVSQGEVKMDVNYALEPDELEAGFVLTCQSHPVSDFVAVDFDV